MLKKLPLGIQTFKDIIEDDYLYVDKTAIALEVITNNKYIFLSRPRRFGKSLFLDTLKNIFEAKKEYFNGLYIEDKWDWETKYPVINISFASGRLESREKLDDRILKILKENQVNLHIDCEDKNDVAGCFRDLIIKAYKKYNQKVVILVDEYDKPLLDNIEDTQIAKDMRDGLANFYSVIKGADEYLKFAFLTGVSKFSKVSIFSGLNNLTDISLDKRYGTICGYTQHDLETTFAKYLKDVDMEKLKKWYNGYNFLGDKVYNPYDILLFIHNDREFSNYWFKTGTPSFLIKLIKQNKYFVPDIEHLEVAEEFIDSFDIENLNLETIMFQSGYLTIVNSHNDFGLTSYVLDFPNKEVRLSFNNYLLNLFVNSSGNIAIKREILHIFLTANLNELENTIKRLFSSIAYNNFTNNEIASYEGFYASVFYSYFASLGLELIAEDVTNKGRIDLTIKFENKIYIFEFKITEGKPLEQIKKMKYYEKYTEPTNEVYIIGIVFDPKQRNVCEFEYEKIE